MLAGRTLPPAAHWVQLKIADRGARSSGTLSAVKSSISIVLFFLLSGFFLTVLLGGPRAQWQATRYRRGLSGGGGLRHRLPHPGSAARVDAVRLGS